MKILQLSTHSTLAPRHGGEIRSHQIGRCLESAGFEVSRLAVRWRLSDDVQDTREPVIDISQSNFWSSAAYQAALAWHAYLADYYLSKAVAQAPPLMDQFLGHLREISPDVILLEHPWTWPLVKNFLRTCTHEVRIIYSSQNVEASLKRQMISDARIGVPRDILDGVAAMEHDLVSSAWATVACTEADRDVFLSWGAPRVIVANNGTVSRNRDVLFGALPAPLSPEHFFAFCVGSAYPPNVSGFVKYVAPALFRLRPNRRIVIAGGMSDMVKDMLELSPVKRYEDRRLLILGTVDEVTLDALIANTSAFLLPIEYGGGSNIKTAEALVSDRPIIATSQAFRGYSEYQNLAGVTIADTPEEFDAAIQDRLSERVYCETRPVMRELFWEATLNPLVDFLRSLESSHDAVLAGVRDDGHTPRFSQHVRSGSGHA